MGTVIWDDFSAGEYGGEDPRKWPKGAWSGVNVVRYVDGSIGPRAGFKRQTQLTHATAAISSTHLTGIAVSPVAVAGQRDVWVVGSLNVSAGVRMWGVELANPVNNDFIATFPEATRLETSGARIVVRDASGASFLYALAKDGTVLSKFSTSAFVANSVGWPAINANLILASGGGLVVYGNRLVVGGHYPAAILYSDPDAFLTWSAGNFVQLSHRYALGIERQRSHLAIASEEGTWSLLTGASIPTGSLRSVSASESLDIELPPVDSGGRAWTVSSETLNPVSFDGSRIETIAHVRPLGILGLDYRIISSFKRYMMSRAVRLRGRDGVALMLGVEAGHPRILFLNGNAWSLFETTLGIGPTYRYDMDCSGSAQLVLSRMRYDGSALPTPLIIVDVLVAEMGIEHPPFANGASGARQWEDSYDDGVAYPTELDLPQHWDPDSDVVLRGVTIDFRKFSTGDTRTNHFDIMIEAHGRRDKGTLASTQTFSFDEATAGGVSGTDESRTFWFGDQAQGRGFQAHLSNLRGVALRGVTAHYESVGSV